MDIDQTLTDPRLFGSLFTPAASWKPWLGCLRATFGLAMDDADRAIYRECTGRSQLPTRPARELWCIVGRRGGKSRVAALIATYLAAFKDYSNVLSPGEQGVVFLIASDRNQARVLFGYVSALFSTPMLAPLVTKRWTDALFLESGVSIEVATASFRSTRGFSVLGAVLDEVSYWRGTDESSANEDSEVLAALRPAMATIANPLLVGISSPYAKKGALFDAFDKHYSKDGDDVLVWRAPSLTMNPSLIRQVVADAYAADEPRARAEFGAEFRDDIEAYISLEVVRECVVPHRTELPPMRGTSYKAFTDPSGGSADSWSLCIGHCQRDGKIVVDALRERRARFVPAEVCAEFAALLSAYNICEVTGDRYAGAWPEEQFKVHGIRYLASERNKSDLFVNLLPTLNGRGVELPDDPRLVAQLVGLERHTARGGRDSIDHRRGAHDDLANAVAGLVALCSEPPASIGILSGNYYIRYEANEVAWFDLHGNEFARCDADQAKQTQALIDHRLGR